MLSGTFLGGAGKTAPLFILSIKLVLDISVVKGSCFISLLPGRIILRIAGVVRIAGTLLSFTVCRTVKLLAKTLV